MLKKTNSRTFPYIIIKSLKKLKIIHGTNRNVKHCTYNNITLRDKSVGYLDINIDGNLK